MMYMDYTKDNFEVMLFAFLFASLLNVSGPSSTQPEYEIF